MSINKIRVDVLPLSRAKPAPSRTQANARTSPAVPALKPSYSQVTRLGIRARDPGKTHVTEAHCMQIRLFH